jgi:hypothetical protein
MPEMEPEKSRPWPAAILTELSRLLAIIPTETLDAHALVSVCMSVGLGVSVSV